MDDNRKNMTVKLAADIKMTIRLICIKRGIKIADVLSTAIECQYPEDLKQARGVLEQRNKS